jgi:hypothetical protein
MVLFIIVAVAVVAICCVVGFVVLTCEYGVMVNGSIYIHSCDALWGERPSSIRGCNLSCY